MTTLMPLVSVTGLVLLLLTTAPASCNGLTPGSHLAPFSRGEVKDEDTSAPGVVINNVVDVKAEDTKADELTESALKDDVLQTLKTTGLNADNHDGLPPLQIVERGTKVTSSRLRRAPKKTPGAFTCTFKDRFISPKGKTRCSKRGTLTDAKRDLKNLLAEGPSEYNYTLTTTKAGLPAIKAVHLETNKVTMYTYAK
ncbi:hypothetical protein C0Q70_18626 [Pomacea canaliculata]|uniref:Uncharacterized protein n=1 Tax=Pomacea canaliculata TaxID=400727 RepID=A0A2T7NH23_POMCA|nr:uncharacterized protein LOC112577165 isoform X4 [Pomacea canaliculata]PVD20470.1 hypothetical protein C0Q70_18626 [Pomacea canaliculata]